MKRGPGWPFPPQSAFTQADYPALPRTGVMGNWAAKVTKSLFLVTTKIKWLVWVSWASILLSLQTKEITSPITTAGRTAHDNNKTLISGLHGAILIVFTPQKLHCVKLRFQLEGFCTYKVRRFVRPLNTPSAMWLMRLSPRLSFSNKPSPTKADSLRRVSWLYDKSLGTLNK